MIFLKEEKAFEKIQCSFKVNILERLGIQDPYLNIMKANYCKPTANIKLNGNILSNSTKILAKTRMSTIKYLCNIVIGVKARTMTHTHKRDQGNTNWQRINKVSLFADVMIIYISDPKNSTRELL